MSSSVIGALRVNLGIDSAQFQDGLKQAQGSADKFAKVLKTTMVAAAGAAVAALGAIAVGVRSAINSADDMSKMAAKIGIPIEELSKLKYAADMSGVSLQGLQTGVSRLSRNMADAAKGTGAGAEAFKRLGINVKGADGSLKSSSAVMAEMADKFAKMPDGAQKTAVAMELMGRSGADMIPMLNGGSAALNELLMEAKELGLEISERTGKAAEAFNDNISRMGYAISGLTLGLTAALAPALVVVSDAMVHFTKLVLGAVDYLPVVAEYATVAGGALAFMFSPAILAAAGNMAVAIGVGLVGAVRLLTAVIMANPLGALAVGITVAVTAIYHFRDEIQKAIGVDVVGIVRDAANLVIGSFVAAYEDIKFVWANFPDIMGAAVIGAANAVIAGTEKMINAASGLLDAFISKVNSALSMLPGGLEIGQIGSISIGRIENQAASRLSKAVGARNTAVADAMGRDYIGAIGKAFSGATPAVLETNKALSATGDLLDDIGGGGGGKGKKSGGGKVGKVKEQFDRVGEAIQRAQESLGQGFAGILDGLISKSISWKEALVQVGQELLRYMNQMNLAQGGKGLFGGGIIQGLFGGLLGFANGGSFQVGGSGGIDSQLVAFKASPNERVSITKPGQEGGRTTYAPVYHIDARGADPAAVARLERGLQERDKRFGVMVDDRFDTRQTRKTRG